MGNYHVKSAPSSKAKWLRHEKDILEGLQNCSQVVHVLGDMINDVGEQPTYELYLEKVRGGSLAKRIKESVAGHMQEADVQRYTKSLLLGLSQVHKMGYIHCNLRPENVLLVSEYSHEVKIANFECALEKGCKFKGGFLRGTMYYAAPEAISEGAYYPPVDIWALGCCIVAMMAGGRPWRMNNVHDFNELWFKVGHSDELPEIPDNLSMRGKDFLSKCLVRDPTKRWTAQMLLEHPFVTQFTKATYQDANIAPSFAQSGYSMTKKNM